MKKIISFYDRNLKEHGDEIESVAWGSRQSQEKRFQVLSEIADLSGKTVLDVGCGLADFYSWLAPRFPDLRYTGIDVTPSMVDIARDKFPQLDFRVQDALELNPATPDYDYVFASGIFNLKVPGHKNFVRNAIKNMFAASRMGTAFNIMSTKADFFETREYYADPEELLAYCQTLTHRVVLRHDYMPHDFSVYLYVEPGQGQDA